MKTVYHTVPRGMVGDVLYPLSQLQAIAPEAYEVQKAKYAGRDAVLTFRIPGLDRLFNDMVHCSPLHPYRLFEARRVLDLDPPRRLKGSWTGLFFAIPLERILVHQVVWYTWRTLWINGAPNEEVPLTPPLDEFEPFDPVRYCELAEPTPAHLSYLASQKERGRPSLMFVHIPHVLVAGPIDVSGLTPMPWDEAPGQPEGGSKS